MIKDIIISVVIGLFVTVIGELISSYVLDMQPHLKIWFIVGGLILASLIFVIISIYKKYIKKEKPILIEPILSKDTFLTPSPKRFVSFLGRKKDLQKIETKLQKQNNPILLTVGIGGIGKTELAKEFFFENQKKFNKLVWIKYTNTIADSFCNSFDWFKNTKDIQERYVQIVKKLQQIEGQNLLVIDDISKEDNKITELTSILPNFKIIGTSRLELDRFDIINIDVLEEEDAIELFEEHYGTKVLPDELEDLKKLLKLIASHTLTIELVAKTSKIKGISIKELLGSLKEEGLGFAEDVKTLAYATNDEQATINKILSKIFDISKLEDNEISLLKQLTVLPKNSDIKISFLKQFIRVVDNTDLQKALHNLGQKGWIRKDRETINIHPVIGDTLLKKLDVKFEDIEHIRYFISQSIFDQVNKNPIFAKQYIIYAEAILEIFKEEKNSKIATLLNNLSSVYRALGQLNKALKFYKKALKIREEILDKNHPNLATSYNNLSGVYKDLGKLDKALEFCKKALKISEQILDENHPDLALVYNNLSLIYKNLGELNKALEYGLKDLKISEQILEKNHPDLATSYNNLSLIYQDLGELDKALKYAKKTNDIFEKILEKNHPSLATSYNNLATIYYDLKDKPNALLYINKAIDIRQKIFPDGHPHLDGSKEWLEDIKKM